VTRGPDPHPLFPAPTAEAVRRAAARLDCPEAAAWSELCRIRAEAIEAMQRDPFGCGFAPPVWTVVWSLLDWPHWPRSLEEDARRRLGLGKWEFMRRMRAALGLRDPSRPIRRVWVSGANGSGKTELMAFMANAQMAAAPEQRVYVLSTTEGGSVLNGVQEKLHRYIPLAWRANVKGETAYVSYKRQTGFAGNSYVFPNGSRLAMKFYAQDPEVEGEGFDADACLADESIPAPWARRLWPRVARRGGFVCFFNTPQQGYTEVVHGFMEGLLVTRWCAGTLLPRDGRDPDEAAACGLTAGEMARLCAALDARPPRPPTVPESRPEDCWSWLEGDGGPAWARARRALRDAPAAESGGRVFEAVPRVGIDEAAGHAVVFFHGSDNPFGRPRNLVAGMRAAARERILSRVYGVVTPSRDAVFAAFRRDVHVLPPERIPQGGTNYMVMDPAPGRNPFVIWMRVVGDVRYVYRELPGPWEVPGIGFPGPWSVTSGRKGGVNDGARGEGARSWGFGHARMVALIAWLEGWRAFADWALPLGAEDLGGGRVSWPRSATGEALWPPAELVRSWGEPAPGETAEPVAVRLIDPRGGEAPRVAVEGVSTLIGDYEAMGLRVEPAFSGTVLSGVEAVSSALDHDPADAAGGPRLFVSEECPNVIRSFETWKNVDGEAAACKDPIDCVRYGFTSGCDDSAGAEGAPRRRAPRRDAGAQCAMQNAQCTMPSRARVRVGRRR